tara:strand:+ start:4939 stop:6003 length:1065 start_codon:yes stop_codon:yes gene_type:complete
MIETPARNAFIVDLSTNTVLLQKQAEVPMPPASMSKLMTVYMVFDLIKQGALSLEDKLLVSRKAWKKGGSKMFVKIGDRVSVADLLRGIIVQSGNDACIVVAEALAGSENSFAELMTNKGRELGLKNSTFTNATGWPNPSHRMSAEDLAILSKRLIEDFPELYKMFSEKSFSYNKIKQGNRNPLLYRNIGADGLKTGHTVAAGYGLTASAKNGDRRIVVVLNGLTSVRQRSRESLRLMEWAFRAFKPVTLFKKGDTVTEADIWLGDNSKIPLTLKKDLRLTLPRGANDRIKVTVRLKNPVPAPVREGQTLGTLVVKVPNMTDREYPLSAGANVEQLGFMGRIITAIKYLIWGAS